MDDGAASDRRASCLDDDARPFRHGTGGLRREDDDEREMGIVGEEGVVLFS